MKNSLEFIIPKVSVRRIHCISYIRNEDHTPLVSHTLIQLLDTQTRHMQNLLFFRSTNLMGKIKLNG